MKKSASKKKKTFLALILFAFSLIFVGVAAVVAVIGSNYMENQNFRETFYCASSLKVNEKIRVIQISDLHNCTYGEDNSELIRRVEMLKPDLIVYIGDCVDSQVGDTEQIVNLCGALAQVAPSFYIYGNNEVKISYETGMVKDDLDEYFGFDDSNRNPQALRDLEDPFMDQLESAGVRVLKNEAETITVGTIEVDVFGVLTSNPSAFWPYAGEDFGEYLYTNEDHLKITAIHEPWILEEFETDSWGDLMLAGHTHGGMVRVPLVGPLYTEEGGLFPERKGCYIYGRYDVQGRPLIVSGGLDNSSLYRINNEPEIVIVDINKF